MTRFLGMTKHEPESDIMELMESNNKQKRSNDSDGSMSHEVLTRANVSSKMSIASDSKWENESESVDIPLCNETQADAVSTSADNDSNQINASAEQGGINHADHSSTQVASVTATAQLGSLPSSSNPTTVTISPPTPCNPRDVDLQDASSLLILSNAACPTTHHDMGLKPSSEMQMADPPSSNVDAASESGSNVQLFKAVQDDLNCNAFADTNNDVSQEAAPNTTASQVNDNDSLNLSKGTIVPQESAVDAAISTSQFDSHVSSHQSSSITRSHRVMTTAPYQKCKITGAASTANTFEKQPSSTRSPTDPSHERRGSGFLLLAAEAMERNESRENAIRRAALEITAGGGGSATGHDIASSTDPITRLFQMPSLHADQLSSTTVLLPGQQQRTWSTANLPVAPLIEPKNPSSKVSGVKSKPSNVPDLLPSGRPRPPPQKHVYHDYALVPDPASAIASTRKKTGGVSQPFPEKLMTMLDRESISHPDIISWLPHGRAFLVRKPKIFTTEIMPDYFRQSKLTSFQRQLNLYGFRRITQGADGGAYYHELFLRGRPNLCARMARQKVKGTGHKQPTDIASEPNFYAMPAVLPLSASNRSQEPMTDLQSQPVTTNINGQESNPLMNSPGIHAATLLKRLSSVGTPTQFSLDDFDNIPPPLAKIEARQADAPPATRTLDSFDSFPNSSESTASRPVASFGSERNNVSGTVTHTGESTEGEPQKIGRAAEV